MEKKRNHMGPGTRAFLHASLRSDDPGLYRALQRPVYANGALLYAYIINFDMPTIKSYHTCSQCSSCLSPPGGAPQLAFHILAVRTIAGIGVVRILNKTPRCSDKVQPMRIPLWRLPFCEILSANQPSV